MRSIWIDTTGAPVAYPALDRHIDVDVAIVGGGNTGLSTALRLAEAGQRVAVLEADRFGASNTGGSTGNLYATVSSGLASLRSRWGDDVVRDVVRWRAEAIDWIESTVQRHGIDCAFARRPLTRGVSGTDARRVSELEDEYAAAEAAGLAPRWLDVVPELPFAMHRAFRIDGQAQFNPYRNAQGLARALGSRDVQLLEHNHVTDVDAGKGIVRTAGGDARAHPSCSRRTRLSASTSCRPGWSPIASTASRRLSRQVRCPRVFSGSATTASPSAVAARTAGNTSSSSARSTASATGRTTSTVPSAFATTPVVVSMRGTSATPGRPSSSYRPTACHISVGARTGTCSWQRGFPPMGSSGARSRPACSRISRRNSRRCRRVSGGPRSLVRRRDRVSRRRPAGGNGRRPLALPASGRQLLLSRRHGSVQCTDAAQRRRLPLRHDRRSEPAR